MGWNGARREAREDSHTQGVDGIRGLAGEGEGVADAGFVEDIND